MEDEEEEGLEMSPTCLTWAPGHWRLQLERGGQLRGKTSGSGFTDGYAKQRCCFGFAAWIRTLCKLCMRVQAHMLAHRESCCVVGGQSTSASRKSHFPSAFAAGENHAQPSRTG